MWWNDPRRPGIRRGAPAHGARTDRRRRREPTAACCRPWRRCPGTCSCRACWRPGPSRPAPCPSDSGKPSGKPFTVGLMTRPAGTPGPRACSGSGHRVRLPGGGAGPAGPVGDQRGAGHSPGRTLAADPARTGFSTTSQSWPTTAPTGYLDHAPFDAIIVTACAPHLPPLLLSQLKDQGYLLIPVTRGDEQVLYRYQRQGHEVLVEQSVSCRFVPLLGGVNAGEEAAAAPVPEECQP